jgi:hypothetical protein
MPKQLGNYEKYIHVHLIIVLYLANVGSMDIFTH